MFPPVPKMGHPEITWSLHDPPKIGALPKGKGPEPTILFQGHQDSKIKQEGLRRFWSMFNPYFLRELYNPYTPYSEYRLFWGILKAHGFFMVNASFVNGLT